MRLLKQFPLYYFIISFVVCSTMAWIYLRARSRDLPIRFIMDLSIVVLISGFIGARIFHVVYEYPQIYISNPARIFDFGLGGYVYYGGFIAGIFMGWVFLKIKKTQDIWRYFDFFAPVGSIGYALGRSACLMAGCCYGPIMNGTWGMKIVDDHGSLHFHHPTPFYSSVLELLIFAFLMTLEKSPSLRKKLGIHFSGSIFFAWVILHALSRFILEFWRADYRGPQFIFSISGWISLILFSISIWSLYKRRSLAR